MQEMILCKLGELVLKGLNRRSFEQMLYKTMRRRLERFGNFTVRGAQSTVFVEPKDDAADIEGAFDALRRVFGIASLSRAFVCDKTLEAITACALAHTKEALLGVSTFKVEAKRADKRFALTSPELMREVGGALLDDNPHLRVDVHRPELVVYVEVRDFGAYIHAGKEPGAGGMPLGMSGRAALLLSGGIDSPVAGFLVAKRGVELDAVHFHSHPYTSPQALQKVKDLAAKLCAYCGRMRLHIVPLTEIQTEIKQAVPDGYSTIVTRRAMMRLAERIALQNGAQALVTGESIGQVASQTLPALAMTNAAVSMPVFRPCIGMDKEEIVQIARKIDSFDTSILPFEDCCTVFTPKHPALRPTDEKLAEAESKLEWEPLLERALAGTTTEQFRGGRFV